MVEQVDNLMLEHFKRFQATLERMDRKLAELTVRRTETHTTVLSLRRDQVNEAEISVHLQAQSDHMKDRLERVERRLELND